MSTVEGLPPLPPPPSPPPPDEEDSNNPNLAQWHHDVRVEWLREKVCIALNVPRSMFNTALETEEGSNTVRNFLDGSAACLLLYPDEIVSHVKMIVEPLPLPPPPPPPPPVEEEPPVEGAGPEEPAEGGKKGKKGKGKKEGGSIKKGEKKDDKKGKDKKDGKKDDAKKGGGKKGVGKKEEASDPPAEPEGGEGGGGGDEEGEEPPVVEVEEPPKPQIVIVEKRVPVMSTSVGSLSEHALSVPVAYFLKMRSAEQAISMEHIERDVEWGVMPSGPGMSSLDKLMSQLFVPMLAREGARGEDSIFWLTNNQHMMEHIGNELLTHMQRFSSQVSSAKEQMKGDLQLIVPNVPTDSFDKGEIDYELILQLEGLVSDWVPALGAAIMQQAQKVPVGKGPLAETEFWQARSNFISSMYEQIHSAKAKRVLAILEAGSSNVNLLNTFKAQVAELSKIFLEAKDNVKFLTTLERHFKTLRDGDLPRVLETISPMMNALRMVWVISKYYSDDTAMGLLMEKIAYQIAEKVSEQTEFRTLTKKPAIDASALVATAKSVLETWSEIYLQVRERIEISGRDPRWEFDRKKLFERTSYMSGVCNDLAHIVEVVNEFLYFLGPELKIVTGDVQGIDNILHKVREMVAPVESLPFDAFDKAHAAMWRQMMHQFDDDKAKIEELTKAFIDTSFKKLRSAEGALKLLQSFKTVKSEGAINRQMMEKFNDILSQFLKEINFTREVFQKDRAAPPISRNQPPVAGSINWSRSLFMRIRKTMKCFQSQGNEMMKSAFAQEMDFQYRALAKQMMQFEKAWVVEWAQTVNSQATFYLKQPILRKEEGLAIQVNFSRSLAQVMREIKYLDSMGFHLPEFSLSVTLQEDKYESDLEGLQAMLQVRSLPLINHGPRDQIKRPTSNFHLLSMSTTPPLNSSRHHLEKFHKIPVEGLQAMLQVRSLPLMNHGPRDDPVSNFHLPSMSITPPLNSSSHHLGNFHKIAVEGWGETWFYHRLHIPQHKATPRVS